MGGIIGSYGTLLRIGAGAHEVFGVPKGSGTIDNLIIY